MSLNYLVTLVTSVIERIFTAKNLEKIEARMNRQ